jgi:hypothetical protein
LQAGIEARRNLMREWLLVLKADAAAARWHVHQRRKGPAEEPYINHLVEVAMLVAEATGGADPNLVIAALLHDAIEDCEVQRELISESFGDDVASIVVEVTDDKSLPKSERKVQTGRDGTYQESEGKDAEVGRQDQQLESYRLKYANGLVGQTQNGIRALGERCCTRSSWGQSKARGTVRSSC